MFGNKVNLNCTETGHYYVPLVSPSVKSEVSTVLFTLSEIASKDLAEKKKICLKLHRQFSHPSYEKMSCLIKDAGIEDQDFLKICREITSSCEICCKYKRTKPRPVVGFSLAKRFNQTVAMDIKEIKGQKVLHLVDHFTRYSVAGMLKSKQADEILNVVLRQWIAYFGPPSNFLVDNGGEFANESFYDMAQNLNIVIRTTPAQSPWSNGLNERHNGILNEMVVKTMEDIGCALGVALPWAISSKNSLHNVNGFSPNHLVFGQNPNMPSVLSDNLPALEGVSSSQLVMNNLNAMHAARSAFVQAESSEKLRRALRHKVRTDNASEFSNGDLVLYKRNESNRWMGPGSVIGTENKQVLVKHGSGYVRVHPCRLQRYHRDPISNYSSENECTHSVGNDTSEMSRIFFKDHSPEEEIDFDEQIESSGAEIAPTVQKNSPSAAVEAQIRNHLVEPSLEPSTNKAKSIEGFVSLPRVGQHIMCKIKSDDSSDWKALEVISRAGKVGGKNKYIMNVEDEDGKKFWLDFKNNITEWKENLENSKSDSESADNSFADCTDLLYMTSEEEVIQAKKAELGSWVENNVFSLVPDTGQHKIKTRWVHTRKQANGKVVVKARLVAKGFQDENSTTVRSDSPTCSKESLRVVLAVIATNGWECNSLDVKTAFLQGKKLEREVFLDPPKKAEVLKGKIWKLNKCVYGLSDASREWYLTVRQELKHLGGRVSKHDQAIFTWHDRSRLSGVIATHVDDFCWAGTKEFQSKVIGSIRKVFRIKSEESQCFKYLGLDIAQLGDSLCVRQDNYVKSIEILPLSSPYREDALMSDADLTLCRSTIGKLNWVATQTRPDISFDVSDITSSLKSRQVSCIQSINKTTRKLKKSASQIVIPNLGNLSETKIVAYCDASFASENGTSSQAGYVIFLVGANHKHVPVAWQSQRVKRVVKSTQAAETLALVDTMEACVFFRSFLLETLQLKDEPHAIPIVCKTDNKGLYESAYSSTQILDKRLRIETAIVREMLEQGIVQKLEWIPTSLQLADGLTKRGVLSSKVLDHFSGSRVALP